MSDTEIGKILDAAMVREEEAHQFYAKVAERMRNSSVREVFEQLSAEELEHKKLLTRMKNDPRAMGSIAAPAADYHVAESQNSPELSIDMPPRDAIALAMKNEQGAVELYRGLASAALTADTKALFTGLANMELGHKTRLESVFVDIGYPEVF